MTTKSTFDTCSIAVKRRRGAATIDDKWTPGAPVESSGATLAR
ncbi:MAG: hypothetical protein ACLP1X_17240 [Polyangiaceae bacterium]